MSDPGANAVASSVDLGDIPQSPTTPTAMEPQAEKPRTPRGRPSLQSRKSSMNGPLYMQASHNKVLIRRVRRKGDGHMRNLARWFLDNQTGMFLLPPRSIDYYEAPRPSLSGLFHDSKLASSRPPPIQL